MQYFRFLFIGVWFGLIITKTEVVSWYRIQEMFHLQSFHMFGVIGSAIAVGMLSLLVIKKLKIKTIDGEEVKLSPKKFHWGNVWGGLLFGVGWALLGACPGPLFALIGAGNWSVLLALFAAILGTYTYGNISHLLKS